MKKFKKKFIPFTHAQRVAWAKRQASNRFNEMKEIRPEICWNCQPLLNAMRENLTLVYEFAECVNECKKCSSLKKWIEEVKTKNYNQNKDSEGGTYSQEYMANQNTEE